MNEKLEQDIIDYYDLINEVAKIDINAALYLRNEAINLDYFMYSISIYECFIWDQTPQGDYYWFTISTQLEKLYGLKDSFGIRQ